MDNESTGDLFASLPTIVQQTPIFDLPASDDDGASYHAQFKMPAHWHQMVIEAREKVSTNLPNVWPSHGAFYRWATYIGIQRLLQIQADLDSPETQLSDDIEARLFLEKTIGNIRAKGEIVTQTREHVQKLSEHVQILMELGEDVEAANLINTWISGIPQNSDFYGNFFVSVLFTNPILTEWIRVLVERGHIIDEDIDSILGEHIRADAPISFRRPHDANARPEPAEDNPSQLDVEEGSA